MFGFKRKEEEQANLALIPQKENIFTKIAKFFKKNKYNEECFDIDYSSLGSTKYSDIRKGEEKKTHKEMFEAEVSTNGMDTFFFKNIREEALIKNSNPDTTTKLIRADLSQEIETGEEGETYKICFEIPINTTLEEFLYADGPYTLIKSGTLDLGRLDINSVNAIGNLKLKITPEMRMGFTVEEPSEMAVKIAEEVYTPNLQTTKDGRKSKRSKGK